MKYSCRLFFVLALGAVLATSAKPSDPPGASEALARSPNTPVSPAQVKAPSAAASSQGLAEPSRAPVQSLRESTQPKPIFVVYARTEPPNQPTPAYDLKDLERYFVAQLNADGIEKVVPWATARVPKPPTPDIYLFELIVDDLQPSHRTKRTWGTNDYSDDPLVHVELTLKVWHLAAQKVIGQTGERRDYHVPDPENLEHQRARLYETADYLADRLVSSAAAGAFGENLKFIDARSEPERFLDGASRVIGLPVWLIVVLLSFVAFLLLLGVIAASSASAAERSSANTTSPPMPRPQASCKSWDQELQEAFALSFETNGFDDAACRAAAAARRDDILAAHEGIEAKEAERILSAKSRDNERDKIAAYATSRCDLDRSDVINTLRRAEQWPYRLLQEAKKLSAEVSQSD